MAKFIEKIKISRFKSIETLDLTLADVNVVIGSNSSGKSNFFSFFKLLDSIAKNNLYNFVRDNGHADGVLYYGTKTSYSLQSEIVFDSQQDASLQLSLTVSGNSLSYPNNIDVSHLFKSYIAPIDQIINQLAKAEQYFMDHDVEIQDSGYPNFIKLLSQFLDSSVDSTSISSFLEVHEHKRLILDKFRLDRLQSSFSTYKKSFQNISHHVTKNIGREFSTAVFDYVINNQLKILLNSFKSWISDFYRHDNDPALFKLVHLSNVKMSDQIKHIIENSLNFLKQDSSAPLARIVVELGNLEELLSSPLGNTGDILKQYIVENNIQFVHIDDTSSTAILRRSSNANATNYLRGNGSNLVTMLHTLQHSNNEEYNDAYNNIEDDLRAMVNDFSKFYWSLNPTDPDNQILRWQHKYADKFYQEPTDYILNAHALSDGTLRYLMIITMLYMPQALQPKLLIIDEIELGLHPVALRNLAEIIAVVKATSNMQIIVSTQSIEFLNYLGESVTDLNVITVDKPYEKSMYRQWNTQDQLSAWLEDYKLGEVWNSNAIGANPL